MLKILEENVSLLRAAATICEPAQATSVTTLTAAVFELSLMRTCGARVEAAEPGGLRRSLRSTHTLEPGRSPSKPSVGLRGRPSAGRSIGRCAAFGCSEPSSAGHASVGIENAGEASVLETDWCLGPSVILTAGSIRNPSLRVRCDPPSALTRGSQAASKPPGHRADSRPAGWHR